MATPPETPGHRGDARATGATLFVVVASAAFATSSPLARWARPTSPLFVAWGRVAIAAAILITLDFRAIRVGVQHLSARRLAGICGAGALLAAHFALFLLGLDRTSMPAAIALVSLEPLSVVLCAWLVHAVRPARAEIVGVGVATAGAVIVGSAAGSGEHRIVGDLLVVGAVVLYGFYVASARGLRGDLPPRVYASLVYGAAAVALAVALMPFPRVWIQTPTLPPHACVAIAALAVVPTVIGHTAVQAAARDLSPAIVALVSPGETVGGIVISALLGSLPTLREAIGAVVVLCGATFAIAYARRPKPAEMRRAAGTG